MHKRIKTKKVKNVKADVFLLAPLDEIQNL